jgi:hypothetical protein
MSGSIRCDRIKHLTTSLLLAVICLWMSGGAQLHHTDDLSIFRTFAAGHSQTLSHTSSNSSPDMCAACEWDQIVGQPHTPAIVVAFSSLTAIGPSVEAQSAVVQRCFDHNLLRGPPSNIS